MFMRVKNIAVILLSVSLLVGCNMPWEGLVEQTETESFAPELEETAADGEAASPTEEVQDLAAVHDLSVNPCDNVFYPLVPGSQWVYKINTNSAEEMATPDPNDNSNQIGLSVASVDDGKATVDSLHISSGVITQTIVECENGAIKNFPLLALSIIFGEQVNGSVQTEYQDGVFVPSQTELVDRGWADTWSGNYILKGNFEAQDEEDQLVLTIHDSPIHLNWETQGVHEAVEVPAGNFPNAIRVEREAEMNISAQFDSDGETLNVDAILSFKNTLWYEPYVGLLKQDIHDVNVKFRGMSFPAMVTGSVELLEYRPAD